MRERDLTRQEVSGAVFLGMFESYADFGVIWIGTDLLQHLRYVVHVFVVVVVVVASSQQTGVPWLCCQSDLSSASW